MGPEDGARDGGELAPAAEELLGAVVDVAVVAWVCHLVALPGCRVPADLGVSVGVPG